MRRTDDICLSASRTIEDVDRELRTLSELPADESTRREIDRLLDERIELASLVQLAEDPGDA